MRSTNKQTDDESIVFKFASSRSCNSVGTLITRVLFSRTNELTFINCASTQIEMLDLFTLHASLFAVAVIVIIIII